MRPLAEQTVLVTGATAGLGRALVHRLAEHRAHVVAHGRDDSRLDQLAAEVRAATGQEIEAVRADLSSVAEVDRLADTVLARHEALHTLVNNAGVGFGEPGGSREVSADGIELRFAVNHLASYQLTCRLLDLLRRSAPARVVQVASAGQLPLDRDDPLTERDYDGVTAYRRSKLAQVMATCDLAAELAGTDVTVNALHPATFMDTAMVRDSGTRPTSTVAEGLDAVWRLVADERMDGVSGRYVDRQRETRADPQAEDPGERAWVRELSDRLVAQARSAGRSD